MRFSRNGYLCMLRNIERNGYEFAFLIFTLGFSNVVGHCHNFAHLITSTMSNFSWKVRIVRQCHSIFLTLFPVCLWLN